MSGVATPARQYEQLLGDRPAAELEEEMLRRWESEDLFGQTMSDAKGRPPFVFFEGPPTANGLPGIHHVFSRTIKDLFCRHRAMRGFHVPRKAGWDTHGLPVEIEVEKQLGFSGKPQIEELGVERFNALCRESVWKYRADWEKLSARIGYWLDYGNPYVTYTNDYIESVWWALSTLFERDLLYRGHKVLPYCPRCGTALSSHEVAQGYEEVEDPSVYVALDVVEDVGGPPHEADTLSPSGSSHPIAAPRTAAPRRRLLVWTTTPWTLVSNVALAVNPELDYVELRKRSAATWTILLAESRAGAVLGDDYDDRWEVVRRIRGSALAGTRYRRPLDWVPLDDADGAHQVIVAESFVSADDGTGIVHMAPAFGADDYAAGQRHGLAFLQPVNARGEFPEDMPVVGGLFVKTADARIIVELERRDVLWKAGTIEHTYPHCWRCGTPLLYYARSSWFIRTTAFKEQMLARNARVEWHPEEIGQGRFGEWLQNNIDWAISRDRYWGTPLPVWVCDREPSHAQAIGSFAALAARIGAELPTDFDPHKPYIDRYEWACDCGGRMKRTPEVIDAWFDSGSMPFAQWHFPFENAERLAAEFPADFIAEGVDQTRGWFYSLLAIATGLGDALPNNRPPGEGMPNATAPYRAVVVNDLVLDAEGRKMSKSRGNSVDPWAVLPRHGADAVRIFLVESSQVWLPRRFDEAMIRGTAGGFLITLRNIYSGIFAQYANFGWSPSTLDPAPEDRPAIDRWILSRLATVEREADRLLTAFEATLAVRTVMQFVVDDVSQWYVRQCRPRFYDVDTPDNRAAFATLHETLCVVCRLLAPFAPFLTDWMHRELTGESVHRASYVRAAQGHGDAGLERAMQRIRDLARLGRAAREIAEVPVRQPLPRLVCVVPELTPADLEPLVPLLAAELNVKIIEFASSSDDLVTLEAKPNFRTLGKTFGKGTPIAAAAIAALSSATLRAFEHGEPVAISVGGESHQLDPLHVSIIRRAAGDLVVQEDAGCFVALDATVTDALLREGFARKLVSRVQRMRKDAGFAVSDRIDLAVFAEAVVLDAVREHREWIASEVLAREVAVGELADAPYATQPVDLDGLTARVALIRTQ